MKASYKEEILSLEKDLKDFLFDEIHKIALVDDKKVRQCKKVINGSTLRIPVPFDMATYQNIMLSRINDRTNHIGQTYRELAIKKSEVRLPAVEVVGWLEEIVRTLKKKHLRTAFYISFKKYTREVRKDKTGIVEKNVKDIYRLQKELVRTEVEYAITLYRKLPEILRQVREEKEHVGKLQNYGKRSKK